MVSLIYDIAKSNDLQLGPRTLPLVFTMHCITRFPSHTAIQNTGQL